MKATLPTIGGVIRRRILVNYRVDPELMQRELPAAFRPILVQNAAIAGICLIRLKQVRPAVVPKLLGLASENAAHRVAVGWIDADGAERSGVYIFRRDSSSIVNRMLGGRVLPGVHSSAIFTFREDIVDIYFHVAYKYGKLSVYISANNVD